MAAPTLQQTQQDLLCQAAGEPRALLRGLPMAHPIHTEPSGQVTGLLGSALPRGDIPCHSPAGHSAQRRCHPSLTPQVVSSPPGRLQGAWPRANPWFVPSRAGLGGTAPFPDCSLRGWEHSVALLPRGGAGQHLGTGEHTRLAGPCPARSAAEGSKQMVGAVPLQLGQEMPKSTSSPTLLLQGRVPLMP